MTGFGIVGFRGNSHNNRVIEPRQLYTEPTVRCGRPGESGTRRRVRRSPLRTPRFRLYARHVSPPLFFAESSFVACRNTPRNTPPRCAPYSIPEKTASPPRARWFSAFSNLSSYPVKSETAVRGQTRSPRLFCDDASKKSFVSFSVCRNRDWVFRFLPWRIQPRVSRVWKLAW